MSADHLNATMPNAHRANSIASDATEQDQNLAGVEYGLDVRDTPVGRGVFATKPVQKHQVIGQVKGELIFDDSYDPSYVVEIGPRAVLEPSAPFRFLNHSCEPNAALVEWDAEPGQKHPTIWVEALRRIAAEEEITIDYAWPAEEGALRCGCGATRCRGWVVDKRQVAKQRKIVELVRSRAGVGRRRALKLKPYGRTRLRAHDRV